jgi:fructosamine-3-kinase
VTDWQRVAEQIAAASGEPFQPRPPRRLGGGCINQTVRLEDDGRSWFVKLNRAELRDMFDAERAGLEAMDATATLRVPRPLCTGTAGGSSFIAMEYVPFGAPGPGGQRTAGLLLAAMHRASAARFGWARDNTIGSTPQHNAWSDDWIGFWREHRLGFQLELAAAKGYGGRLQRLGARLLDAFPALIDHAPVPALLHGDLWGGNLGFDAAGGPVIFDPATYYGDREAELAMTELFGGFTADFYAAYREAWPLDPGYGVRKTLYNLYHILNHLNLFGGGYASQAEAMMTRLLAEL